MPRGNPQPWFRPSRNTWYVTFGGVQHNLRTADRDEAFRLWHEMMANGQKVAAGDGTQVVDLLALFADHCQRHNAATTYEWYRQFLESFAKAIPPSLTVGELKPFHVSRWLDAHPGWGPSTRRGAVTAVKRAFSWAVSEGYLDRSPIATIRKPQAKRRETILDEEQRGIVLAEASDAEFRDLLILLVETGVRPQEIRRVEARHVDLQNGVWVFPPAENKTGDKTGKARVVYLTPKALEITRRLVKRNPAGPLLRNSAGEPWTRNAIRCRFVRLRKRLKDKLPPNLCCYTFRHSYPTLLRDRRARSRRRSDHRGRTDEASRCDDGQPRVPASRPSNRPSEIRRPESYWRRKCFRTSDVATTARAGSAARAAFCRRQPCSHSIRSAS